MILFDIRNRENSVGKVPSILMAALSFTAAKKEAVDQ
jgi:hypothetical protein